MNPKSSQISLAAALVSGSFLVPTAQAALTLTGTSYTQNFDGLGTTTGSTVTGGDLNNRNTNLNGWYFLESGSGANTTITAGTGSANSGDTYNFGTASGSDRALGGLQSGSVVPSLGFYFTNNTGSTITDLAISFLGETWRVGTASRSDRIDFQYSADATSLSTGTWTDFNALDYANPGQAAANGSLLHSATISSTLASLSIANGSSYFLRWTSFDASGADDGMAIDDFSLTATLLSSGTGLYWVGADSTRGGAGDWTNTGGSAWSTTDADLAGTTWDSTKTAIFNTAAADVNVPSTVNANKGITFAAGSNGSTISGGTAIALGGATAADNTIATASSITATIATNLTGTTGMTKADAGTLVLTGAKDYTGGTTISAGTLQLGDGSLNGSVVGNITNNATLAFNNGLAQSFTGDISGTTGALIQSGPGVLTLSGTNSYAGGTTVSGGGLVGSTTSLQGNITNNSAVTFDQAGAGTYAGNMGGSGSLTKSGAGNVTLSGSNFYSGGTTVSGGTLTGTTTSLKGAITNNAAVVFDQSTSGTYAGDMTGSGSLTKSGTGNVNLSGTNDYSGGTTVSAGTLTGTTGSLQGAITNNATVAFAQSTSGTYAGVMIGTGSLTKSGTGAVTLSGANDFSGGTTVADGKLIGAHNTAFGSSDITVTGGSLLGGASVTIGNDIVINAVSAPQLLITQYYEGPSTNKWIEITNIGGSSIDLAAGDFRLGLFANTNAEGYKTDVAANNATALTGTLGAGASLLYGNSGNTTPGYATADVNNNFVINFNGNDSIALYTGSTFASSNLVDAIGFTNSGNEGTDTSFVRATTGTGYNLTSGSNVTNFASVWSQEILATVDGATAGTDNRLGYSSLTSGASGSATLGSEITSGTATFSGGVTLESSVNLTAADGGTVVFSGDIVNGSGAKGITKIGDGVVALNGTNTYTGATAVDAGVLEINGSTSSSSLVTVNNGGKLAGDLGTIGGNTTIASGGKYSAGLNGAVGSQTFSGDLTLASGSIFEWDLTSASTLSDFDTVTGASGKTFTASGDFRVVTDLDFSADIFWDTGKTWNTIFNSFGTNTGWSAETDAFVYSAAGVLRDVSDYGSFTINGTSLTWTAVPEPTSALAGILLGAGMLRRRRRATA